LLYPLSHGADLGIRREATPCALALPTTGRSGVGDRCARCAAVASKLDTSTPTRRFIPAPTTFATKGAADRWLNSKRAELDAGTAIDERAGSEPLSKWWSGYWRSLQSRKPTSRGNYSAAWRLRVQPRFGSAPVRRIKPSQIDDWIADMNRDGVSPTKAIEAVGVLKRLLDRAVRDKAIPSNPCVLRSVSLPKRPQMERPVLSPAEVERLAMAMRRERDRVLVRLLAYGGLRVGKLSRSDGRTSSSSAK
jgi:integrase